MSSEHGETTPPGARALAKLRVFIEALDAEERKVIATLLAPAVEEATEGQDPWTGSQLDRWLAARTTGS